MYFNYSEPTVKNLKIRLKLHSKFLLLSLMRLTFLTESYSVNEKTKEMKQAEISRTEAIFAIHSVFPCSCSMYADLR